MRGSWVVVLLVGCGSAARVEPPPASAPSPPPSARPAPQLAPAPAESVVTDAPDPEPPLPEPPRPSEELRTALQNCSRYGELFSRRFATCLCETTCRVSQAFTGIPAGGASIRMPFVDVDGLALELDEHGRALTCGYTAVGHDVSVQLTCPARP